MWRLATAFAEIAVHRRSPADLPASEFLVVALLALYLLVELVNLRILGLVTGLDTLLMLVDCAFFLAYVFVTLRIFGRERRFRQTIAALLGTDILLDLIALPLFVWVQALGESPERLTVPAILYLLWTVWWIDIAGYILARAIARPYIVGVLFVIPYMVASLGMSDWLAQVD